MKIVLLLLCFTSVAFSADAPAPVKEATPAVTVATLTAENTDLKARVAALTTQVAQLQAAALKLQEQRDQALNASVQAAIVAATPPEKKP